MQENKNLVEEALIQMKQVEEAIAENAKGILASTMKEEISQLVKESLSEQDELDVNLDAEVEDTDADNLVDTDVELDLDVPLGDEESTEFEDDEEEEFLDLSDKDLSDDELLKVFKAMGEEDGIIIKKDGDDIHLTDNNSDEEYLIKLGESENKNSNNMKTNLLEVEDAELDKLIDDIFRESSHNIKEIEEDDSEVDEDEVVYEIEFTESEETDEEWGGNKGDYKRHKGHKIGDVDGHYKDYEMMESDDEMMESDDEMMESDDEMMESDENWQMEESYSHKKAKKAETKESKMSVKPKGTGIGKGPKFNYKDKVAGGFKEDKKEGPKMMGTGKAKFEYKKGENMEGSNKVVKKMETKEAARTLGMGSDFRKGGLPKPRAHSSANLNLESLETEVSSLREKNEEYRKALNVFREKLNEVAIFNSNLAYATRLFTEHSTTKKEKINILRRFDNVETLKESKSLYRSIKDELSKTETKSLNETVENKLAQTVQTGSSTSLIENKTYEAPQFLRIKDLMSKIS